MLTTDFFDRQAFKAIVPNGRCGDWRIEQFIVSKAESETTLLRAIITDRISEFVAPGIYTRLVRNHTVVMSDTLMELQTNSDFIHEAHGSVLINGLGLGVALAAILRKPEVKCVTIIEAAQEVITLVAPAFQRDPRVQIIHADAFTYQPANTTKFDVVWHDIWDDFASENLSQMDKLENKYAAHTIWQASWGREICEALRQKHNFSFAS
jgi:hypothetical protein